MTRQHGAVAFHGPLKGGIRVGDFVVLVGHQDARRCAVESRLEASDLDCTALQLRAIRAEFGLHRRQRLEDFADLILDSDGNPIVELSVGQVCEHLAYMPQATYNGTRHMVESDHYEAQSEQYRDRFDDH